MTICNRGNGPTPAAGTYWGAVTAQSLQGRPSDVSLCRTSPALLRGYCSINFATTSIGAGNCISIAMSTLCPGVDFSASGAGGGDRTTIQWNMPDWPQAGCGNKARVVGECDDKNNFTVNELGTLLACQGVGCGKKTTAWLRGRAAPKTGAFMFSFETPVGAVDCGTPNGLGRVFFSGQHTSGRASGNSFPGQCDLAAPLTEAEMALAFHYFALEQTVTTKSIPYSATGRCCLSSSTQTIARSTRSAEPIPALTVPT